VQSASDGYLAEVMIGPSIDLRSLAAKLRDLVDAVVAASGRSWSSDSSRSRLSPPSPLPASAWLGCGEGPRL